MTTTIEASELADHVGEHLGYSDWHEVTQDQVNLFADATGDHQWIHVDPERAASGPFGTTIAHGYLTLSLLPHFGQQLFRLEFGTARINYGLNKVRFPVPVPVGSTVRAKATFVDLREGAAGATLTTRYVVELDGAAKPACVAESLVLLS